MSESAPRIAIVAGEASGDILGAGLIEALKQHYPNAEFIGVGGPLMAEQGLQSQFPMDRLSVMGITEVLGRLPELLRLRRELVAFLFEQQPDVYIGIDSPDFNLPIARRLHEKGIKTVHYVSPSVWAWRQGRIHGIKANIDLMLCLLPFETDFYRQHQMPAVFVGHPLADEVPLQPDMVAARTDLDLPQASLTLAMLPGSRGGEVSMMMPIFLQALTQLQRDYPQLQTVIPAANEARLKQISTALENLDTSRIKVVLGQGRKVMQSADLVLLASGTATLEAMLLKKPMVVGYRMGWFSALIIMWLLKAPHVALPNLLANERLVPELIQKDLTVERLVSALKLWLDNPDQAQQLRDRFMDLHRHLQHGGSKRAAAAVADLLDGKQL